jgi:TPR repeat protein
MGAAYESGKGGVEQDFAQALAWLSRSANQGNADAQYLLGHMFEDAKGVPQDYAQAGRWYRAACEHRPDYGGAGQGCNSLGVLYLTGHGVKQSRVEAYKYFKLGTASEYLSAVKSQMSEAEIAEAERQASEWLSSHSER